MRLYFFSQNKFFFKHETGNLIPSRNFLFLSWVWRSIVLNYFSILLNLLHNSCILISWTSYRFLTQIFVWVNSISELNIVSVVTSSHPPFDRSVYHDLVSLGIKFLFWIEDIVSYIRLINLDETSGFTLYTLLSKILF